MARQWLTLLTVTLVVAGLNEGSRAEGPETIPIKRLERESSVDFSKEVLPILRRKCLACHNESDAESDLVLETAESILKGGSLGPAVTPSDSNASLLLQVAAFVSEPTMPPEDNEVGALPLTPEELGLIQLWIEQGAQGSVAEQDEIRWQSLPAGVNPVYAVAISPDGQFVAAGRANQIFLYHLPTAREVGRLTDPRLIEADVYDRPGVAHLDLVQSLRFSPDSRMLASGGYRTVKLWQRASARKLSLTNLGGRPSAVAISPGGKQLAVGNDDGQIVLVSGATIQNLSGHGGEVRGLAFVDSGSRLMSASRDRTVRVWSTDDGSQFGLLETPAEVSSMVMVGPKRFATGGTDGVIRIWNRTALEEATTAAPDSELKGHGGPVTSMALSASQSGQLVSGSHDGTVRVWDLATQQQLRHMDYGSPIEAVAARADGTRIAAAGRDKTAILWDEKGEQVAALEGDLRYRSRLEAGERAVAVSQRQIENAKADLKEVTDRHVAEEKHAKTAVEAKTKAAADLEMKAELAKKSLAEKTTAEKLLADAKTELAQVEQTKLDAARQLAQDRLALSQAAAQLETARQALAAAERQLADAQSEIQKAETVEKAVDREIQEVQQQIEAAELRVKKATDPAEKATREREAAERALAAAERAAERAEQSAAKTSETIPPAEAAVKAAEERKKHAQASLTAAQQEADRSVQPYDALAFTNQGRVLATGGADRSLRLWDADTGVALESHAGHRDRIQVVAAAPSGDVLTASVDGELAVWGVDPSWRLTRTIGAPDSPELLVDRVTAIDFAPDGTRLATGSGEPSRSGQLKIWDLRDGSLVREFQDAHSDTIQGLEFSPDGRRIASCGADRFAKIFELETGELVRTFEGHTHHVLGISWRADGRMLATAGADNVVKIWDVNTGEQDRTISGFSKEVTAIRFLATGDQFVASSGDSSVQLKNASNGKQVRSLAGATDFLYSVTASASGKLIAAGGQDSVVRVWKEDGDLRAKFAPPE